MSVWLGRSVKIVVITGSVEIRLSQLHSGTYVTHSNYIYICVTGERTKVEACDF